MTPRAPHSPSLRSLEVFVAGAGLLLSLVWERGKGSFMGFRQNSLAFK